LCFTETTHFVLPTREELKAATQNTSGLTQTKETPAATKEQKRMLHRSHVPAALKQRKAALPRADSSRHLRQRLETKRCCDETQKELTCGTNTTYTNESGTT
jgi:hypothetical protein